MFSFLFQHRCHTLLEMPDKYRSLIFCSAAYWFEDITTSKKMTCQEMSLAFGLPNFTSQMQQNSPIDLKFRHSGWPPCAFHPRLSSPVSSEIWMGPLVLYWNKKAMEKKGDKCQYSAKVPHKFQSKSSVRLRAVKQDNFLKNTQNRFAKNTQLSF